MYHKVRCEVRQKYIAVIGFERAVDDLRDLLIESLRRFGFRPRRIKIKMPFAIIEGDLDRNTSIIEVIRKTKIRLSQKHGIRTLPGYLIYTKEAAPFESDSALLERARLFLTSVD